MSGRASWGLLAVVLLGCGHATSAYEASLAAGDRAKSSGRYDEAATAYREAGDNARKARDREEGYYLAAATLEQAGRYPEAREAYQRLIEQFPGGERTERVIYDLAWMDIQHGDAAAGWAALERAILQHPGAGSARRALREWVEHLDEGQAGAGRAWLEAHRAQLLATDLGEDALYLIAQALRAEGKGAEARQAYVDCATRYAYPFGALADDSWWHAAELAEEQGDPTAAIAYLERLLSTREVATLKQGSYERPRYAPARYKIAELVRDRLHDDARARREFHRVYREHTTSLLRDDALWNEALLARKARDEEAVCGVMATMTREFPESRFSGCAPELCPKVPASSRAPACRDYLKATLAR